MSGLFGFVLYLLRLTYSVIAFCFDNTVYLVICF